MHRTRWIAVLLIASAVSFGALVGCGGPKAEKEDEDVIHQRGLEQAEGDEGGAKIIDLMAVLRKSLSKSAVVKTADESVPISLDQRRKERAAEAASRSTGSPKRKTRRSGTKRKGAR